VGVRFDTPGVGPVKIGGVVEFDFYAKVPSDATEQATLESALPRLRLGAVKLESPVVDVLVGQYWDYFGFQPQYFPTALTFAFGPGEPFSRKVQVRVTRTFSIGPLDVEAGIAALRPPQEDGAVPQGEAGLRVMVKDWMAAHSPSTSQSTGDKAALAISAAGQRLRVAEFSAKPEKAYDLRGYALGATALVPVIAMKNGGRKNAVSLTGQAVTGTGDSTMFVGLTGGIPTPALPLPAGGAGTGADVPVYTPNFDAGLVGIDPTHHTIALIEWRSWRVGAEYYLPVGNAWVAAVYQELESPNIDAFAAKGLKKSSWVEASAFVDVTKSLRLAAGYSHFRQRFVDGGHASEHRIHTAAFFFF
jgi:hypothetical protein